MRGFRAFPAQIRACGHASRTQSHQSNAIKANEEHKAEFYFPVGFSCTPPVPNPVHSHCAPRRQWRRVNYLTPGGTVLVNGGTTLVNGGATLVNGGTTLVNGGAILVNGDTTFVNGGATFVNGGTTLVNGGTILVNGGATLVNGGFALVKG
jgi:hypothetical protein